MQGRDRREAAMQKIHYLDQQIKKLQEKKDQLEQKRAVALTKNLDQIWGERIGEDLILGLLTWAKKELDHTPDREEAWRKLSPKFRQLSES